MFLWMNPNIVILGIIRTAMLERGSVTLHSGSSRLLRVPVIFINNIIFSLNSLYIIDSECGYRSYFQQFDASNDIFLVQKIMESCHVNIHKQYTPNCSDFMNSALLTKSETCNFRVNCS